MTSATTTGSKLAMRSAKEWKEICDQIADEKAKLQAKVEDLEAKIKEMQS